MGRIRFVNLLVYDFLRGFGCLLRKSKSIAMQEGREEPDKAPLRLCSGSSTTVSSRPSRTLPTLFPSTLFQNMGDECPALL
jgi:hypothetical protein